MKGVVFVELLKMAESLLGEDAVDNVLDNSDLPSGGIYTSVGDYSCDELMTLVQGFSKASDKPADELTRMFGHWMMETFARNYPEFFNDNTNAFSMLESVEDEIHVEVRKLYPTAELPHFDVERRSKDHLHMKYHSSRPLTEFCHGLIEACLNHFDQKGTIERKDLEANGGAEAEFDIRLKGG